MKQKLLTLIVAAMAVFPALATYNIAPLAKASASSCAQGSSASAVNDGVARIEGRGEWVSDVKQMFWGEIDFPWVRLDWDNPVKIDKVLIYDRMCPESHAAGVALHFSDGSTIDVGEIPENGAPKEVLLNGIETSYIKAEVIDGTGDNIGLSEIEVYPSVDDNTDPVAMVNPFVETTRGRYFFFISGCQPFGMIGAAPLTRNKNQGGGGYNYNDSHILGFPQIHAWMLSGLTFMPADAHVNVSHGEQSWKSRFSHAGEVAYPSYHRVYLEDYGVWVEQTATQRTSAYRLRYSRDKEAALLFNLGGHVATSTMVNADVKTVSPTRLEGSFQTVGRLWGGPDSVKVFFVVEFDRPFKRLDSWNPDGIHKNVNSLRTDYPSIARNEGMSYHDAPSAGLLALFDVKAGEPLGVKMAISYTSVDNAVANLNAESADKDFDTICNESRDEWNDWLSRISVKGGSDRQRIKFYTDLWHTLLGRHKINDADGSYPDRTTGGTVTGKNVINPDFRIKRVPLDRHGKPLFNMYNSDALWLTQWNQNTLWGLAWPEMLDEFSASMLEYAKNGGLIPRGPCGGGYSFIMSGCPATSLITSAYQRDLTRKWNPRKAYPVLKRNHERGGMLGHDSEHEFDFYLNNGYAPGRAGLTVQWVFEDWALSRMAERMGRHKDAEALMARSKGWRECIHPELHLLLPRQEDGSWLHTDPLSNWGYEEANAWQTTFGLSNDLDGLALEMGGYDRACDMLQYAFENSVAQNFTGSYGNGYVSYANQPGLSTAHVFSHWGKPWLTQYWTRQVLERAYGSVSPSRGYGEHDEDQGQMSAVSALMALGLFSVNGGSDINPCYEITAPVFDEITIKLDSRYYPGKEFKITTKHQNAADSNSVVDTGKDCYIQSAVLNGRKHDTFRLPHSTFAGGGELQILLGPEPNRTWGTSESE